jgi:hypothetical protein
MAENLFPKKAFFFNLDHKNTVLVYDINTKYDRSILIELKTRP